MGRFQIVEHTADVGIKAQGECLEDLFEQAGRGLAVIIGIWSPVPDSRPRPIAEPEEVPIDLQADDLGGLLVDWLEEIVYLSDVTTGVLTRVQADRVQLPGGSATGGCRVTGRLWLGPGNGEEADGTAVKAITYHRLKVAATPDGWAAEVYVDV
jgi:SHS2 domain-containing protein